MIQALQRCCTVEALENLSGSSPFADDLVLHSDGPEAISAMRVIFNSGGAYLQWLHLFVPVNMQFNASPTTFVASNQSPQLKNQRSQHLCWIADPSYFSNPA